MLVLRNYFRICHLAAVRLENKGHLRQHNSHISFCRSEMFGLISQNTFIFISGYLPCVPVIRCFHVNLEGLWGFYPLFYFILILYCWSLRSEMRFDEYVSVALLVHQVLKVSKGECLC